MLGLKATHQSEQDNGENIINGKRQSGRKFKSTLRPPAKTSY